MKFITYVDEFGDTQYLQPHLVTHTQCHHFQAKDENFDVPKEYRGTLIGFGPNGYVITREKATDIMKRILEHLDGDN